MGVLIQGVDFGMTCTLGIISLMAVAIGSGRGYGLTPSAVPYNGWLDVSFVYRPELRQLISGLRKPELYIQVGFQTCIGFCRS